MWEIWQDSPEYGCTDNPSHEWFANKSVEGHIVDRIGPYKTEEELRQAIGE